MADEILSKKSQSLGEVRQWDFDFGPDLVGGVTVESAVALHITPVDGVPTTPTVGTIQGDIVPIMLGPVDVIGMHKLVVSATLSDGEISEMSLVIPVIF